MLPRSALAIHNWEIGMGISTVYGDAQWVETARFAAFPQRGAAASSIQRPPAARACAPSLCANRHSKRRPDARGWREEEPGRRGRESRGKRAEEGGGAQLGDHGHLSEMR